ncbi:hypothetical protein P3T16_006889 [Paraburkholderia sp. GAS42]|jgi:hypothetical protein
MTVGVPGCGNEGEVFLYMDVIPAKAPPLREIYRPLVFPRERPLVDLYRPIDAITLDTTGAEAQCRALLQSRQS